MRDRGRHRAAALRRCLGAAIAVGVMLPASASGHAAFIGSDPQPGVRLESSPPEVVLSFTEPLNPPLSRASLIGPGGEAVRGIAIERRDRRLALRVREPLMRGAYRVRWHTVSTEDGHALEGEFSFGVQAAATGGSHTLVQSPLARAGWMRIVLRVLLYGVLMVLAAAVLVPLLIGRGWITPERMAAAHADELAQARDRADRLRGDLAWMSLGAAAGVTLAEAADAAGRLSASALSDFLLTGGSGTARVALLVSLGVIAALRIDRRLPAAVAVLVALLGLAASGHAASASPRLPSIVNDWLHLASGAVWLGGIAFLVLVWGPGLRSGPRDLRAAIARDVLSAFGRIAVPAFVVAVATGAVSLLVQLGHLDALWTTSYGRVLTAKIVVVGIVAGISFVHARRLRPQVLAGAGGDIERRHWRLLRVEPAVGVALVIAVAVLVTFPLPPRQLAVADDALTARPACEPCPLPAPRADELAVADHAGPHLVAGWIRRSGDRVAGTIRVIDRRGRPVDAATAVAGARSTRCGAGCVRFSASPAPDELAVTVADRTGRHSTRLPARWLPPETRLATRLLRRAERTMRSLRGVREIEEVTSGPGSYARTEYRLRAPDRMAFRTALGAETVILGERRWFRANGQPWTQGRYGSGVPFTTRGFFRWSPYARAVRLLGQRRENGREVAEIALADEATPVWFRLVIDVETGRVLRERMTARAHFMTSRYADFNRALTIRAPDDA